MPRFAANLGFTPLEPTKSADGSASGGVRTATDVPAAQFDWTSSGLVNPLDGKKTSLQYFVFSTCTSLMLLLLYCVNDLILIFNIYKGLKSN